MVWLDEVTTDDPPDPRSTGGKTMNRQRILIRASVVVAVVLLAGVLVATAAAQGPASLTPEEELGKFIFFDTNLSTPPGQSCAACHAPEVGFTGPDAALNDGGSVYPGAVHTRFGNRKPPTSAYGAESPILYFDEDEGVWIGGMFWDGRATGWTLGDPLAEQAQGPFLNPLEQNNPNPKSVCLKIRKSSYAGMFEEAWGPGTLDCVKDVAGTYERIARSIAAYERSSESNAFTSKYDYYLRGQAELSDLEEQGFALFAGNGKCALCHILEPSEEHKSPLFTDFTYDNLGIPKNPVNPFYSMPRPWNPDGANWVDYGLGGFLKSARYALDVYEPEMGKFKVPTLRNVDLRPYPEFVKAFGHNGYFKSLEGIVHFYNTRDVLDECPGPYTEAQALAANCWPAPELADTVNVDELGDLGLTTDEEAAIVAFMKTLSDGYVPVSVSAVGPSSLDGATGTQLFLPALQSSSD
jgi:cytochrome c peroxidase